MIGYINIGGEETAMFMNFIEEHIEKTGKLLVSGLVEWSFDWVKEKVENKGFKLNKNSKLMNGVLQYSQNKITRFKEIR